MTSFCQGRGDRIYYLGQVSTSVTSSGSLTLITPTAMRIKLGWNISEWMEVYCCLQAISFADQDTKQNAFLREAGC